MKSRWGAPIGALLTIVCGLALKAGPSAVWGERAWYAGLIILGAPVVWRTLLGLFRGRFAADVVAMLAILTAVALGQPLPGLVVVLMQTGGEALEHYAAGRASRAVEELEAAAPRRAHRIVGEGTEEIAADQVRPGDLLLVRPGDMVPCDAEVVEGHSHVDASRLTGEPVPVSAHAGVRLLSGSLNGEGPLRIRAVRAAGESQYARIVQLVRSAAASKSPLQRMADRYAVWFTPLTLLVCLLAWLLSGDVIRVLSVLVVATPCPLILAAPVAMIGGLNRAARRGIIIRHGEALERLGLASAALLDKTGTLTVGRPEVGRILPEPPHSEQELLSLAAGLDSGSSHVLARPIVAAAQARGLPVPAPSVARETPGLGIVGTIEAREVAIGAPRFLRATYPALPAGWPSGDAPGLRAWVTIDGAPGGAIEFADRVRPEARDLVRGLERLGLRRIIMVTGDTPQHAAAIGRDLGLKEVRASLLAADKVRAVEELEQQGERVVMVGDGTNDAPALSRASVGIAMASHGGGITAEAADAVILADNPALVLEAITLSRRTMTIARQSVFAGLALSGVAMLFAAAGQIPPVVGAMLQEAIDVAVILNALRSSGEGVLG
ncbi:MAG TPA: heavy metal translocating P-type ATPase [Gemmatimonadales bacterium]|nr:heavy metal translocating P-type ATPase [Gemmatimonadales bacterium]